MIQHSSLFLWYNNVFLWYNIVAYFYDIITNFYDTINLSPLYTTNVKSHPVFFSKCFLKYFIGRKVNQRNPQCQNIAELTNSILEPEIVFGNISLWIRLRTTIWVIFEADYKIKLLVITSGKREITRTFQNFKNALFGYCFSFQQFEKMDLS